MPKATGDTTYSNPYPEVVPGVVPSDIEDGTHSVSSLAAKRQADQQSVNKAAAETATSKFDGA